MRILIGVDGSESSFDAVRMAARLVDPARDAVAIYFSPLELQKRLPGRSQTVVDDTVSAVVEEARRLLPGDLAARAETHHVHGPVAHAMQPVAGEILGDELPVAGDAPFLDRAEELRAAVAAVPGAEALVESKLRAAEILLERNVFIEARRRDAAAGHLEREGAQAVTPFPASAKRRSSFHCMAA